MNMLDDAVVKDIYAGARLDESLARFENRVMHNGQPVPINNYDNHFIHVKELDNYRKAMDYQKLKFKDPQKFVELELLFNAHRQEHMRFVLEMQRKQAELAERTKGGQQKNASQAKRA
jgi:hypothetical protein